MVKSELMVNDLLLLESIKCWRNLEEIVYLVITH